LFIFKGNFVCYITTALWSRGGSAVYAAGSLCSSNLESSMSPFEDIPMGIHGLDISRPGRHRRLTSGTLSGPARSSTTVSSMCSQWNMFSSKFAFHLGHLLLSRRLRSLSTKKCQRQDHGRATLRVLKLIAFRSFGIRGTAVSVQNFGAGTTLVMGLSHWSNASAALTKPT